MIYNFSIEELLSLWLAVIPIEKELEKKIRYVFKKKIIRLIGSCY
jgi:hypothetical protein